MKKKYSGSIVFEEIVTHTVAFEIEAESEEDAMRILGTVSDSEMANGYNLKDKGIRITTRIEELVDRTVREDYELEEDED